MTTTTAQGTNRGYGLLVFIIAAVSVLALALVTSNGHKKRSDEATVTLAVQSEDGQPIRLAIILAVGPYQSEIPPGATEENNLSTELVSWSKDFVVKRGSGVVMYALVKESGGRTVKCTATVQKTVPAVPPQERTRRCVIAFKVV